MRQKKYTLPRHTNLSNQGPRLGAFLVDLAVAVAIALGLIRFALSYAFRFKIEPLANKMDEIRLTSKLFYLKDNKISYYLTTDDNKTFKEGLEHFYTVYIPYEDADANKPAKLKDGTEVDKKAYFTVEWFNKEVLKIEGDGGTYFAYQYDGETPLKGESAVIKDEAEKELVNRFLQHAWEQANYDLNQLESFKSLNREYEFYGSIELVIGSLVACALVYIVVPIIFKNGQTLGKKAFGLALANSDGYKMKNSQLLMRIMPAAVVILALLIPIWARAYMYLLLLIVMLLVSFALSMSSPKRMSLHDFTARTIVINARTSTIFNDSTEEEIYIAKEDGIELESKPSSEGEEPDIKYEKY